MGAFCRALAAAGLLACLSASSALSTPTHATTRVLTYRSPQALKMLLAHTGFKVERNLPALHAVEVSGSTVGARPVPRYPSSQPQSTEPAVRDMYWAGVPYEWEYTAAHVDQVPDSVLRAAARIKIAVIDTGVDLRQPDIAAKNPQVYSVIHPENRNDVRDYYGHGTFVASLAAGSVTNGDGIAGFGGDAQLLCVQVASRTARSRMSTRRPESSTQSSTAPRSSISASGVSTRRPSRLAPSATRSVTASWS